MSEQLTDNTFVMKFAQAKQPDFKEYKREGYIQFGDDNHYAEYLLRLYNSSAKHGAITRNKAKYISGNGWNDAAIVAKFMLNVLLKKVALDIEVFAGAYLEVIW